MDEIETKLTIPIDATHKVAAKQSNLHSEVQRTRSECQQLQKNVKNIIAAAIASRSKVKSAEIVQETEQENCPGNGADTVYMCSSTNSTMKNTVKSIDSINEICNSSSDEVVISDDSGALDGIPEMDKFLKLVHEDRIDVTDELIRELYNVNVRIDTVNEVANRLQEKWCEIDTSLNTIKKEIDDIKQYIKKENLLLHNFRPPPKGCSSLHYSEYIANELNKWLPHLPVKVKWEYISTAHTLPTKSKKSKVIVVRFTNRNVKEAIYNSRKSLPKHLSITEHLTEYNLSLFKKAQELFGYGYVHTDNCKILVDLYGKSYKVSTIDELHKLFVDYCEFIGSDQSEQPSLPPTSTYYIQALPHYNTPTNNYVSAVKYGKYSNARNYSNSNISNHQSSYDSNPSRRRGYRGKQSTGYSVYNRKPLN